MKKVCVLMSTYNGEKYLRTQIDSILNQENVDVNLIVRDDGSSDNTVNILKEYAIIGKLTFYAGENLKPAFSFINLLKNAPESNYYAFADQDDFWMKNKLEMAINKMEDSTNDLIIYFSNIEVVDKELNTLFINSKLQKNELAASFISSPAIGCTMVINNNMRKKIIEKELDNLIIGLHDSWIYRVGMAVGAEIIYDSNYYIKYRQHENNVIGLKKSNSFFENIKDILQKREKRKSYIAKNILDLYQDEISVENINILDKLKKLTFSNKIKDKLDIILDKRYRSYSHKLNIKFIYDVFMGRE